MGNRKITKPERPVEPYSWNSEHMSDDLMAEWKDYIEKLEDYVSSLEQPENPAPEEEAERVWGVFYRETWAKTIYVRAKNREEAEKKAEKYFGDNPLGFANYIGNNITVYTCSDKLDENLIEEV